MSRNSSPTELALVLHHTTDRAYLVSDNGDRDKAVWLAKSLVEIDEHPCGHEDEFALGHRTRASRPIHNFLVPEWLANERGLL